MPSRPYVLAETNWKAIKDSRIDVAVLPWGATEPHNYHLPFGTDNYESTYVAEHSAEIAWNSGARVMVLPTVPFGVNTGQLDLKFAINMNPSTQFAVLRDVASSLAGQGIKKLAILNSHGGNDFRQMIRELQATTPIFICTINWWTILKAAEYFDEPGDHAGEMETSMMMVIKPDVLLPLSEAGAGKARKFRVAGLREGWVWAPRKWSSVTADTGTGNPRAATREKGERFIDAVTKKIAGFLSELASADINDLYE
jgi:creatinine amidohydrolase